MIGEMSLESFETLLAATARHDHLQGAQRGRARQSAALRARLEPHHVADAQERSRRHLSAMPLSARPAGRCSRLQVGEKFGDEVRQHLEFIRLNGYMTASGIPVVRYRSPERLYEIMAGYRSRGVMIANPHVVTLEDGSRYKRVDADQLGFKHEVDPMGLLNPGKMRSFRAAAALSRQHDRCRSHQGHGRAGHDPDGGVRRAARPLLRLRRHRQDLSQRHDGACRCRPDDSSRRIRQPARPVGLRKIDAA